MPTRVLLLGAVAVLTTVVPTGIEVPGTDGDGRRQHEAPFYAGVTDRASHEGVVHAPIWWCRTQSGYPMPQHGAVGERRMKSGGEPGRPSACV